MDEEVDMGMTAGCGYQLSRWTLPGTTIVFADIVADIHQEAVEDWRKHLDDPLVELDIGGNQRAIVDIDQRLVVGLEGRNVGMGAFVTHAASVLEPRGRTGFAALEGQGFG